MNYLTQIDHLSKSGKIPADTVEILRQWYFSYVNAASTNGWPHDKVEALLSQFLKLVIQASTSPHSFAHFHQRIKTPFDYYQFGLDFIRPLVITKDSHILHPENIDRLAQQIAQGDNAILLANHQTELDPQAISLLLEKKYPSLAENMIMVAGHRVVTDPIAIPFSMGCNLLCINSKKYIEDDPSRKEEKLLHNQSTMLRMSQLLSEGGKVIYVAPSGGRDRPDRTGHVDVAHFDPQSIEFFWLMAQRADHPTHFYPLALSTYHLLPPPDRVEKKLGELRSTSATPIRLALGAEIDMENFPGSTQGDKRQKRKQRAQYIWEQVRKNYQQIEVLKK